MQPSVTRRGVLLVGASLALLTPLSCSSSRRKLYPVRGKVLFDGKPAEGALVTLYARDNSDPMEVAPRGHVKTDGSFTVGTFKPEDGAPAGEYKVTVMWFPPDARERLQDGRLPNKLPPAYSDPSTSGLRIQVKEEANDVPPFQLTAKK